MTDEEIHDAIPDAVVSHATANRDDQLSSYGTWDEPLRIDHIAPPGLTSHHPRRVIALRARGCRE